MSDRPVAGAAGVLAAVAAFHVVDHRLVPRRWHLATHLGAAAGAVAAGVALGLDARDLGMEPTSVRRGVGHGAAVGATIAAGVTGTALLPRAAPMFDDARVAAASPRELARWALLEIPLATAVYEEVLFRGVLLGLARQRWTDPVAVALTSALFGAWHVLPALEDRAANPATATQAPVAVVAATVAATTAAGVGFAALRLRTGSLAAPVLVHTATNVVPLLAARLVQRRTVRAGRPA